MWMGTQLAVYFLACILFSCTRAYKQALLYLLIVIDLCTRCTPNPCDIIMLCINVFTYITVSEVDLPAQLDYIESYFVLTSYVHHQINCFRKLRKSP